MKIGKTGFQRKYTKKGKSPKTALFQQSKDLCGAQTRNRTKDTGIFSPLLYLLSYLGIYGAEDEIRTRDPRLGKAMLYP